MADTKISALTAAGTLDGTEIVPISQAGSTVRTTTQGIANLAPSTPAGVSSFNTRTGAVTLTASDVDAVFGSLVLKVTNNLSDLGSASTARTNLGLGTVATLASDTDGTLAANSDSRVATQKAVVTYIASKITGLLDFKGSTDCSSNPNYPSAVKGDSYVVSVAGKIGGASGTNVDVGDVYFALADNAGGTQAAVGSSWDVLEHNLVGALLSANNLSDLASVSTARTNLGLAIGSNVQAWGAALDSLAAGSNFVQFSGPTTSIKTFTLPDSSATLLYSSGALGTPSSGTLTNCTGLPNAGLVNASVTVTAGTGMSGGGAVTLGSSVTLSLAATIPQAENITLSDSGTTNTPDVLTIQHSTSGTPAGNFGAAILFALDDTTTSGVSAGEIDVFWNTATHASRKGTMTFSVYDTSAREVFRIGTTGSAGKLSYFGAGTVAQQTVTGTRTGTLAQLQTVVANLLAALANYNLIVDSTS